MITRRPLLFMPFLFALPAQASIPIEVKQLIDKFTAGKPFKREKLSLEINPLIENGNSVSIKLIANHPMREDNYITRMIIFSEKNPQLDVATFYFTPFMPRAEISTRMRLATSQSIHGLAQNNKGEFFYDTQETIVTLAACLEE